MGYSIVPLERLTEQLERLPGIGRKSAARLAFHLLYMPEKDAKTFIEALTDARDKIHECPVCCNLTDSATCPICGDNRRDRTTICVVEDPRDVLAFECDPVYGTDWVRYTMRVNTRGFEQVGIAVCDLGGSALYDNIRLFEEDKGIGNQDLFVSSVKTTNKVTYGAKASVTVNATGDGLKYKWYYKSKNGSKFEVATSYTGKTYSVAMDKARDGRQVYCVVTDKYGNTVKTTTVKLKMK